MLKVGLICIFALGFVVGADYEPGEDFLFPRHGENNTTVQEEVQSPDLLEATTINSDDYNENGKDNTFCTTPPDIEGAVSPTLDSATHPAGTIISYHCPFGHVSRSSSNLISVCRIDKHTGKAEWTRPSIACIPRSCGDPGYVANARRIGNLFTFPNKVEFECQDGYRLRGLKDRYCQAGGEWSGRLPVCDTIYCAVPSNPVNGRVFYSSLEYGTELQYECNKGFKLQNDQPRTCSKDGTWSNNQPECIEIKCSIPEAPEHGTVLLSTDEPKVGTLALYSCNDGLILAGATTSKCLKSGNWTFDTPKCLSSCSIYEIEGGEFGKYETRRYRYSTVREFVAFKTGELIKNGETVIVRCKNGFSPDNNDEGESNEISCYNGSWSKYLQCYPKSCTEDPPPIENGYAVGKNLQHGKYTWYRCYKGYNKTKIGAVLCSYGKWEGTRPVCSDTRCFMDQLNYSGLVKPQRVHVNHGVSFEINCEEGYTSATEANTIFCLQGNWNINENPCRIMTCEDDPPPIENGKIRYFHRQHYSTVEYECDDNYELIGHSSVQCMFGEWNGQPPFCDTYDKNLEAASTINMESTNPTLESGTQNTHKREEECFCSYDYRPEFMEVTVSNRKLLANDTVKFGEKVLFECLHRNMDIVWPNGLRFFGAMELTCDACQHWQMNDLPKCETSSAGQSYIIYDPAMRMLPRGIIGVQKSKRITMLCVNQWLQPLWHTRERVGINFYAQASDTGGSNRFYKNYIIITEVGYDHEGEYLCFAEDAYRKRYSSTKVELKIIGFDVTCPELSTDTNRGSFNIEYEYERKVNSTARYSCRDSSQKFVGQRERKCLPNGKWSGSYPACENDIRCPFLNENNIFLINYSNDRKLRSAAFYYCTNTKQKIIGSNNRTCLHTGEWSGTAPVCEDIICLEFPTYNGLFVSYTDGTKVQSVASFSCSDHRTLVGNSTSVCLYSGIWSAPKPSCELLEIRCPKIDGQDIFTIKYTKDRKINSTAQFFCKADGQKVSGCNFVTCQSNGEWSGDYPTCVDYVSCEKFIKPPNFKILYSDEQRVESLASFECVSPDTLSGSSWARCRSDGTWSHSLPSCDAPKCSMDTLMQSLPEGVIPDMQNVTSELVLPGLELELLCEQGLIPNENSKASCNSRGHWDFGNVQCVSGCRMIPDVSSKLIIEPMKNYYRFGEFILLSCPPGHKLTSEVERLMCMGKSWSNTIPDCAEWKDTTTSDFRKTTRMISRS